MEKVSVMDEKSYAEFVNQQTMDLHSYLKEFGKDISFEEMAAMDDAELSKWLEKENIDLDQMMDEYGGFNIEDLGLKWV